MIAVSGNGIVLYRYRLDDGDYSGEVEIDTEIHLGALEDGTHAVSVIGGDSVGNWQSTESPTVVRWTVDTTALAPLNLDLASDDDSGMSSDDNVTNKTADLTISGFGEDGATVQLYDSGAEIIGVTGTVQDQTFTIDIALTSDGSHRISARQTDTVGNVSSVSGFLDITIDGSAPSVGVTEPSDDSSTDRLWLVEGTASDPSSGVDTVELQVTDGDWFLSDAGNFVPNPVWVSADGTDSWQLITSGVAWLLGTDYTITARATDRAGNTAEDSISFTYGTSIEPSTIGFTVSEDKVVIGELLTISGQIEPPIGEAGAFVDIMFTPATGQPINKAVAANSQGLFSYGADCGIISQEGSWVITASWDGNQALEGSTSGQQVVEAAKADSLVTLDGTSYAIRLGEQVTISGKFTPQPDCGNLSGIPLTLIITNPDGVMDIRSVETANQWGHFLLEDHAGFDRLGEWKIQANFPGSQSYLSDSSDMVIVRVVEDFGRAIILGGGVGDLSNTYFNVTKRLSTEAYRDFLAKGFTDDMILFVIDSQLIDIDNDEEPDTVVDTYPPSVDAFVSGIREHYADELSPGIPLFVYMQGHATEDGRFKVWGDDDYVPVLEIKDALDQLQGVGAYQGSGGADCPIVFILEACFSGNFIPALSGPNRVILTSAGDERYNTDATGRISFSRFLFSKLREGDSLKKAFDYAAGRLVNMGYPSPKLEDNGDGIPTSADGLLASNTYLNGSLSWGVKPVVEDVVAVTELEGSSTTPISARVTPGDVGIERVWVQIISPNADITGGAATISYPEAELTLNVETGNYEGTLIDLTQIGPYKVIVLARDVDQEVADPAIASIYVQGEVQPGDVNGDGTITLVDAILSLKIACGMDTTGENIVLGADVNADSKIGLAEMLYVMQKVAGLR